MDNTIAPTARLGHAAAVGQGPCEAEAGVADALARYRASERSVRDAPSGAMRGWALQQCQQALKRLGAALQQRQVLVAQQRCLRAEQAVRTAERRGAVVDAQALAVLRRTALVARLDWQALRRHTLDVAVERNLRQYQAPHLAHHRLRLQAELDRRAAAPHGAGAEALRQAAHALAAARLAEQFLATLLARVDAQRALLAAEHLQARVVPPMAASFER